MNTYLIPVTKEFQSIYTDIMVIYANTEKEAYYNAQIERGFVPITIRKYTDVPYESYSGKLKLKEYYFPILRKRDIIKQALCASKEKSYMEIIDIYDYMYWGDYNLQIQKLAEKHLQKNGVLKIKMIIIS